MPLRSWHRLATHLLVAVTIASIMAISARPALAQEHRPASQFNLSFADADVRQVADEVLGGQLGLTYLVDPAVSGQMSFRVVGRLSSEQLLSAFEAALATHDLVLVRDRSTIVVMPRARARAAPGLHFAAEPSRAAGYQLVAAPVSFVAPSDLAKMLQSTAAANLVVFVDDKLGLIVLGGTSRELEGGLETVRLFDRSGLDETRFRYLELINAPATVVVAEFQQVASAAGVAGTTIVPLKRLNGVIIFAHTPAALATAETWVRRLDVPSREEAASLWLYRPKNLGAENLAQALNAVIGASGSNIAPVAAGPSGPPAADPAPSGTLTSFGGDPVHVAVEKGSNTLIIAAPASRWTQIKALLTELDRTPDQVLINVQIVEVTLSDEFRFGVDWRVLDGPGRVKASSTTNQGGGISAQFPGFSITYLDDSLQAALNALGAKTHVEVLSAPKLVVLDNHTAKLQIGDQVPVVTQTSRSSAAGDAPIVASTEYRNTGVILEVTPRINSDNTIVMEIMQEVSSVAKTTTSGIDSPTIQQRRLESTLMVRDGGTVALGGLISSTRSTGNSGVPWIKDIPVLGSLFGRESREQRRTELIVLITPRVQKGDADPSPFVADMLDDMRDIRFPVEPGEP